MVKSQNPRLLVWKMTMHEYPVIFSVQTLMAGLTRPVYLTLRGGPGKQAG